MIIIKNMNINQNNNQYYNPQPKKEQKPKNPDNEKLKNAYNLFMQGITNYKKSLKKIYTKKNEQKIKKSRTSRFIQ